MAKNKRFAVVARTSKVKSKGLKTSKGNRLFKGKSALYVSSQDEAQEIEQRYGKKGSHEVNVVEDERLEWHEDSDKDTDGYNHRIHHYQFSRMGLRERMYDFSKDPDYVQVRPGVWRKKNGKEK